MQLSASKIIFPPVKIKLHWPDYWSPCCLSSVVVWGESYECTWCGCVSVGHTEYMEGRVIAP